MWKRFKNPVLELFFPAECFFCKTQKTFLCDDCATLMNIASVHQTDRANRYIDDIYSAGSYDNKYLQKMICSFKYKPFLRALGTPLARLIAGHFELAQIDICRDAVIIPVPLAKKRLRWRGYNQAQELASELGKLWYLPVENNSLARARETKNQAQLSGNERQKNTKGAFVCPDRAKIENKTVYLIDDVITTGATMDECAMILKRNSAAKVIGIAIARAEN